MKDKTENKQSIKQIFRTRITHSPFIWFKLQKYMAKYKFNADIPYYSKGALCGKIIEYVIKGDWDKLKDIHDKFNSF